MLTNSSKLVNRAENAKSAITLVPAAASQPIAVKSPSHVAQLSGVLKVSSPSDPAEREAESTAQRVMRIPDAQVPSMANIATGALPSSRQIMMPGASQASSSSVISPASVMRLPHSSVLSRLANCIIQREPTEPKEAKQGGAPVASSLLASQIASQSGDAPLPPSVRQFMEPRFGADFSNVRIHTGERAGQMSRQVNARAFTVGNQIFFGAGHYQPDSPDGRELIAHELTHTIQQGGASQKKNTEPAVQRSVDLTVAQFSPPEIQRWGLPSLSLPNPLNYIADKANLIPGFRMFTIVLGVNPINMSSVDRSPGNILRAVIEFVPGASFFTQALENHGVFDKVGNWVAQQIASLGLVGSAIKQAVSDFIRSLSPGDLLDLGGAWDRAKRIFTAPIDQIINFVKGLATGIINFIKDAILKPLAALAKGTPAYDLLCAVLGKDPVTGESVPQDAEALIGGFMKLIGQQDVWAKMKTANAVPRAFAWFNSALSAVKGFVQQVPTLFINAFKSLVIMDIVLVPRAFAKIAGVFGGFVGSFMSWAGNAVWNLLEIIFDVISPGALGYVKRTGAALKSILKNPLPFVGNLVNAAKLGFQNFAGRFGGHLKAGLIDWLTGSLPGVYIPRAFSLGEIVKFVFSVLGLTWQNVRQKLVKVVGEPAVAAMEVGFDIVKTLVTQGPAAAWDKIKDALSNLQDMVIGGITDFVVDMVVKKAVPKMVAMFIPGAGFISAILSIYDTVMVFVNKISKIIQVVTGFINSITAIAAGNIAAAASKVESTLAGLLSLAINFLAGFAGLGKVADKVMGVINKVRAPVDKALDSLIKWIVTMAKKLFAKVFGKDKKDERTEEQKKQDLNKGLADAAKVIADPKTPPKKIEAALNKIKSKYKMTALTLVTDATTKDGKTVHVHGEINPTGNTPTAPLTVTLPVKAGDEVLVQFSGQWQISTVSKIDLDAEIVWCDISGGGKRGMPFAIVIASFGATDPDVIAPFNKSAKGKSSNPYAGIPDIAGVGPKKDFTATQKAVIIAANLKNNGGVLKSDKGGAVLVPSVARQPGVKVDPSAAEIDHDYPRSRGGWNTYANAIVLGNRANIAKSNKLMP
ncbi:MAG: DUF4157 domain-containing protein [Pseudomonadota bacterium]